MRIAFVSTILNHAWGGADTLWTHAAEAAAARGDSLLLSVSPVVATHPRIAGLLARGAVLAERSEPALPQTLPQRVGRKLRRLARPHDALLQALAEFQPERVIFSQAGAYDLVTTPRWLAWLTARRIPFRVIVNWQSENPYLGETELALARDYFTAAERLHFVSTRNLAVTRRHLLLPLPQAHVVQNPLRWEPADLTPWPDSPPLELATVSRLDAGKGIQLLLHALATLGPATPAWRLNLYGHGPFESHLRAVVAHLGLADRVTFRGHVGGLRAIWSVNHLMCSPAIDDGVPMTIPEAMLCGRPVLATCVGGAEDWIQSGRTGFLCPAPTVPLLTATLLTAFAARERWPDMGSAAHASARQTYRPHDYLELLR